MKTDILQQIKDTLGTNDKIFLAVSHFTDKEHEFMSECFNNIIYGISETNIAKAIGYDKKVHGRYEDLGEFLIKNPYSNDIPVSISINEFISKIKDYSGNKQIEVLKKTLLEDVSTNDMPWYIRVLLKNPRIGISHTTYDKIRIKQGLKPLERFYVKLAKLLEPENFTDLNYPVYCEIKYDGERAIIYYNNGVVSITSRNGNDISSQFPEIVKEIKYHFDNCKSIRNIILDGEIISNSFNSLQKRMNRLEKNIEIDYDITFICFDIISLHCQSIVKSPQEDRRNLLETLYSINNNLSKYIICGSPEEAYSYYERAVDNGEEGIIIKEMDAKWALKNNDRDKWYKVKPVYTSDLEIVKVENGKGKNKDYINILYVKDYTGSITSKVSSGMTDEMRKLFTYMNNKEELIGQIVEIKYNQITDTNSLRHPRIVKLRLDKDIADKLKN